MSDYRRRLEEKQKLRLHYGLSERQLRGYFARALPFQLLERRLDNVVFRLGFAPTIPGARQLVVHGHVFVNGGRVDRPSQLVDVGDRVTISPRGRRMRGVIESAEQGPQVRMPGFLNRAPDDPLTGLVVGRPHRDDVPFVVDENAIVEFYAR
jgi:small subunit ribosomal protein S4